MPRFSFKRIHTHTTLSLVPPPARDPRARTGGVRVSAWRTFFVHITCLVMLDLVSVFSKSGAVVVGVGADQVDPRMR